MKHTHFVTTGFVLLLSLAIKAQTPQNANDNTQLKEQAIKANQERQKKKQDAQNLKSNNVQSNPLQLDGNDPYQGRSEEFKRLFASEQIPEDFPKYNKSYDVKAYNQVVDSYCAQHLNLLKPNVRQKIEGHP